VCQPKGLIRRNIRFWIHYNRGRTAEPNPTKNSIENYPIIIKPRDNSGSRGVLFCADKDAAEKGLSIALENSKLKTVIAEEFIFGEEYSIETVHYNKQHTIIQYTKKITTKFPYNVEMGHIAPAPLDNELKEKINALSVPKNFTCLPVLIHVSGVSEALENTEFFYKIIDFSSFLHQ